MIANCTSCGIIWTDSNAKSLVIANKVQKQPCSDCRDFDWPNTTKRNKIAAESVAKPKSDRKASK